MTQWIILSLLHTSTSGEAKAQFQTHYNTTPLNLISQSHELEIEVEVNIFRSLLGDVSDCNFNIPRSSSLEARDAPTPFGRLKTSQLQTWLGCCHLVVTPGNDLRHS